MPSKERAALNARDHNRVPLPSSSGNPFRGILMVIAAGFAFWRGWQIHHGRYAWMAFGLGVLALALAAWHFLSERRNSSS